jgi:DNA-binding XRE family transcriptional regulator
LIRIIIHSKLFQEAFVMEKNTVQELLGRRVRSLRKAKNLTKEELAAKCELHFDLIEAIERAEGDLLWRAWQRYLMCWESRCLTCSGTSKKKDFHPWFGGTLSR